MHKIVREGHPRCVEDLRERKSLLEALMGQMQQVQSAGGLEQLNATFLSLLLTRIAFHGLYPDVAVDLALQKYLDANKKRKSEAKRLCA